MRKSNILVGVALLSASGCQAALYGEGDLYLWNGTEETVTFVVEGRSPAEVELKFERGHLFEGIVAGTYSVTASKDGTAGEPINLEVTKARMTVVNFERVGCFARADVAGMYSRGRDPVRVLQIYTGEEVMALVNDIAIKPGAKLPGEAPRLTGEMAFQRLVVFPCNLLEDPEPEEKVAQFVRRLR